MRKKDEPGYILNARQHLAAAQRRAARQEARVARIEKQNREVSRAEGLYKALLRRQMAASLSSDALLQVRASS
jgi:hypothetical protein